MLFGRCVSYMTLMQHARLVMLLSEKEISTFHFDLRFIEIQDGSSLAWNPYLITDCLLGILARMPKTWASWKQHLRHPVHKSQHVCLPANYTHQARSKKHRSGLMSSTLWPFVQCRVVASRSEASVGHEHEALGRICFNVVQDRSPKGSMYCIPI